MMSVMEARIASLARKLKAVTLLFHTTTPSTECSKALVSYCPTETACVLMSLVLLTLTGTGGDFPIVIGKEDLDLGENTVKIVFTSARRATVELEILLRNFNVICSAKTTSDSEYVEISCVLRESSQTIAGVTYAINGVDKGALQGMLVSYT